MKTIITLLLLLFGASMVIAPNVVRAEEPSTEAKALARKSFERGMTYYQKDDFDKAIEQFDVGYRLIPQPVFLFNIAQAYRLSDRLEKALDFYRRYLRESPEAKNRVEVEKFIATLEKTLVSSGRLQINVPADAPADEPAPAALLGGQLDPGSQAKNGKKNRKVLPIVLGVISGALVVGAAIGLGVYFGTRPPPATLFEPITP